MDVSIIIVNYKTVPLIVDCIRSIRKHVRDIVYEVIVVDNYSEDNFQERLQAEFGDTVVCVPLLENIGFGRANNEGFKVAGGRNIFCLNPDTELINNAVKILSVFLDNHSDVGICGGNLYNRGMIPCLSYRRLFPSILWEMNSCLKYLPERLFLGKSREHNFKSGAMSVAYVTGADLMIKRELIEKYGFFDPSFFMYYEDTELCYRIKKNGFKIYCIPEAKIFHYEGKSCSHLERKAIMNFTGREIFYKKYYSKLYTLIADCFFMLGALFRIMILSFKTETNLLYWKKSLQLAMGKYTLKGAVTKTIIKD